MQKLYLSFDIEADGPSPAHNNMLSLGIYGFDQDKNEVFTWQKNFFPRIGKKADHKCMTEFWDKQPQAWAFVNKDRVQPSEGMLDLAKQLKNLECHDWKIVWVAWPSAYDWQWLNTYYQEMLSVYSHLDLPYLGFKATCASSLWTFYVKEHKLTKKQENILWEKCSEGLKGNHNSLEDAKVQGLLYYNLMKEAGIF